MVKFKSILLILKIYTLVITVFFIFRLILFFTEIDRVSLGEDGILTIFQSFIMGLRFDLVISGYILLVPALVIFVLEIIKVQSKSVSIAIFYWIFILFSVAFFITAADVPYFNQFFSRLSMEAFLWMDNYDFVFKMILQEPRYYLIIFPFLILNILFFFFLRKLFNRTEKSKPSHWLGKTLIYLLFLTIMFLGVRGRIQQKSPIRTGTAYFSDSSFLNKLGLNPVFTLLRSFLDSQQSKNNIVNLMDKEEAIGHVQNQLGLNYGLYGSPIAREVIMPDSLCQTKPNVVLVIMESMSAAKMKRGGDSNNLAPFLDSLSYQSYYFNNFYTAGKHTCNGIFSTLFSYPALYSQQPLKQVRKYNGLSYNLKNNGYSTTYFTTHDGQFDNVEGFLKENNFDEVITQSSYPISEIKTSLGVPDDYMFRFSIPIINRLDKEDKPFFVTFMTASDHGPHYIPEYFSPKSKTSNHKIVEYADWSLKQFISLAKEQSWFSSTIFIFVADHGTPLTATYDISLDYHHSPFLIYAPSILNPREFEKISAQIDVFPTLMGILNQPYINNSLGIDLLKNKRAYAIINDDDKIGILDNDFLLIMKEESESKLYKYKNLDKFNYSKQYPDKVKSMEMFAKSNLQVFQDILLNHQQDIQNNVK